MTTADDPLWRQLAKAAAAEPFIGHGCEHPTDQQAELIPADMKHRHPYIGRRPQYSGYCVIDDCACECHQASIDALPEEMELNVFDP